MTGLCTDCPKRPLCSSLCPEAELYVKQDEVSRQEIPIGLPIYGNGEWPEGKDKSLFTKAEVALLSRLVDGRDREQIAEELGITRHSLKLRIQRLRKKRLNLLRRMEGE